MSRAPAALAAPADLETAAVGLLRSLIRHDTVNPPGNERALQLGLKASLEDAGFECELLAAEPERPNLLARLRGEGEGPTLALLGHVDTVRADPAEWSRDPWSGELAEGWVWGRGALDMKGQVASEVAAALELGRSGWRPAGGELLLVLTVDEETGGELGARWLCERHPDRVRSDFVLNEGGGTAFEYEGGRFYPLCVGEKGIFRVRLKLSGRAGHSSMPTVGENALLKLAPLISELANQPPRQPNQEGLAFLSAVQGEPLEGRAGMDAGLERLRSSEPLLASLFAEPMMGITLSPTIARAGDKANVIPASAEALIDCRVPPGLGAEEVRAAIEALLGEGDYELEFNEAVIGNASPLETDLTALIRGWLAEADPGAGLAPIVWPAFSDSHWFREAFDSAVVYGFCPHREIPLLEATQLLHSADERVPVADVGLAARFFFEFSQLVLS